MGEHTTMRTQRTAGLFLATTLLVAGVTPGAASAQETDERWLAFSGCWQPVGESAGPDVPDALLCFEPLAASGGVAMVSLEDGEIVGRETLQADGQSHEASLEGCTGWERGDFSARPGRVFLSSEYVCDGGVSRASTGVLTMVSFNEWVDVRVVTAGDERLTWVTRYRQARQDEAEAAGLRVMAGDRGMAVRSARAAGSARPSIDDVIEATGYIDSEAVQAWIAERDAPLDLDSDKLIQMADAGVPEDVIDMVVAVSYPERFAVAGGSGPTHGSSYGGYVDPRYGSLFFGTYGFGFGYGFGYGYGYGGGYGGGYYRPIVIVPVEGQRGSGGRVVNGRGYRRGEAIPTPTSRGTSVRTPSRGSSRGASAGRSSGGSSRGTSTGRTARRRGGGGS